MSLTVFIFYSFIVIVLIQVTYYVIFLIAFNSKPNTNNTPKNIAVSVIICAKNEAKNLVKNIPSILNQDYPNFEIVLVNDGSTDNTLEVMESIKENNNTIKIVDVKSIEKFWGNKKYALTLGIKAATHDFLLFTDADCKPASPNWIAQMTSHFSNKTSLVLGYGGYKKEPSFLNKLIRFETLLTAIQYISYAKLGNPYMGVGRNLAYRKSLFLNNSGFMSHMNIKSGDDDLFVNEVADKSNTAICIASEGFTISIPKSSFKKWIAQKKRHISTAKAYKKNHKLLLSFFYMTQLGFWVLAIFLLSLLYLWKIILALVVLRLTIQLISIYKASKILNEKGLIYLTPILEIFLVLVQLYIFSANQYSKQTSWK